MAWMTVLNHFWYHMLNSFWNKVYNYAGIYNMCQKINQIIFLKQLGLTGYYIINLFINLLAQKRQRSIITQPFNIKKERIHHV